MKNQGVSNVARNLRLMADAVEKGSMKALAVATVSTCEDPYCTEQHIGEMFWLEETEFHSSLPITLLGAVHLLNDEAGDRYRGSHHHDRAGGMKLVEDPNGK